MGHRQLSGTSETPEVDHTEVRNHLHPPHAFHSGSGFSSVAIDNLAGNGLNTMPFNPTITPYEYVPSSSLNIRPFINNAAYLHDPYQPRLAASNSVQFPLNYPQYCLPSYGQNVDYGNEGGSLDPQEEIGKCHFKRRNPPACMVYDKVNTNQCDSWRRPSDIPSSSNHFHQVPMSGSQVPPWNPEHINSNYRGKGILVTGEGSHRNVRPRYTDACRLDSKPGGSNLSSNIPSTCHLLKGFPAPSMMGQWNHNTVSFVPDHRALPCSDSGFVSHGMNQTTLHGSSSGSALAENDSRGHCNLIPSENLDACLPILHCPTRVAVHNNHHVQGTHLHGFRPSYPECITGLCSFNDDGRPRHEIFSRNSVPLSFSGGHSRERNGRTRVSYSRYRSFPDVDNVHSRRISEGLIAMDRSTYNDARNMFDQHRDMRLDIDNMSYEELLALEERIGCVNTGLSEEMISRCVSKIIYCSPDQVQEEQEAGNCVICLESFKDREVLGFLKCGHDYHACCIKQWLQIKNACPICKTSALEK